MPELEVLFNPLLLLRVKNCPLSLPQLKVQCEARLPPSPQQMAGLNNPALSVFLHPKIGRESPLQFEVMSM